MAVLDQNITDARRSVEHIGGRDVEIKDYPKNSRGGDAVLALIETSRDDIDKAVTEVRDLGRSTVENVIGEVGYRTHMIGIVVHDFAIHHIVGRWLG